MLENIKEKLRVLIYGEPKTGLPISSIKGTTHVCMPDERVDFNTWAITMQVSSKTKSAKTNYYENNRKMD